MNDTDTTMTTEPRHPGARRWGPNGEFVDPPAEGDDQRRCWTLLLHEDGGTQCLLFNGHGGEHQWASVEQLVEELTRYGGLIAVARGAHEKGQKVHVALGESCIDNVGLKGAVEAPQP